MRFIGDLHIHSRYSRATSRDMTPEGIWRWAQLKGISVVGTGDFTHPQWIGELNGKLDERGDGLFELKRHFRTGHVPESCRSDVFFLLSAEISCIYRKKDRTRKVHAIVFVPRIADALRINESLSRRGNLASDGRPILGLDAKELLKIVLDASPDAMLVPAHAWTPHFSVFGAVSGFDSLEECFDELTPHIRAIETGLSSDPSMNWRISSLDGLTLMSNSDAHSPAKMGREANIFDTDVSYAAIMRAISMGEGFAGTIEFFPEEGKYHFDGHRACGVSLAPSETVRHNYLCPVCGRKITVGVLHRVDRLADREEGFRPKGARPYVSVIPLPEILAETLGAGVNTKKVANAYFGLIGELGNEFRILMDVPLDGIGQAGAPLLAEAIGRMRNGTVNILPGYDGEFGKIRIFGNPGERKKKGQEMLF